MVIFKMVIFKIVFKMVTTITPPNDHHSNIK